MSRKQILLCLVLALMMLAPAFSAARAAPNPNAPEPAINPLTGLPVSNPANLTLPPALVSITNFPASARPQAGLSFAPIVFETYIGEGMTRFLAVFYGDYPVQATTANGNQSAAKQASQDATIGPIRSGRLAYEKIRRQYNGFLVLAGGYQGVLQNLRDYTNVYGSDGANVNSAMIPVSRLEEIAKANQSKLDASALSGMSFDAQAPQGKAGTVLWLPFSYKNQVFWRYDAASGAYNRYQDKADAKTFVQATDRLNSEPLTFENVIVLFAEHQKISDTIYDLNLRYINRAPALLFRDGKMYEIFWTTANSEYEKKTGQLRPIRFIDAQRNPFPLKPGQTWIETVTPASRYFETVDSQSYLDLVKKQQPGSGIWAVKFMAP